MVNPYIFDFEKNSRERRTVMTPEKRHFTGNLGSIYKLSMGLGRHRVDIQSAYSRHKVGIEL
jgi:hypothetical protein